MDLVSESHLTDFCKEHGLTGLGRDIQFENFATHVMVNRHYSSTFDSTELVIGSGGDTGIDGVAILVNGSLILDIDDLEDHDGDLDITFIFVQAETSAGFDAAKIGSFGFGVQDYFSDTPKLARNQKVEELAAIRAALFKNSIRFTDNPTCRLYYVTTGKWVGDQNLEARRVTVVSDLENTSLFRAVTFECVDALSLQKLYRQSKNSVTKSFNFEKKVVLPETTGVTEAYIGFMPAKEFLKIIVDEETNEINRGLFDDNVRDWVQNNQINAEIKGTLESAGRSRFVMMNNGITIIARGLKTTGNKFHIWDFSVVNGCQTSHVLFDNIHDIDDSVMVPVRLISTKDESIINDIIRGTNRQTPVTDEQFFAVEDFPKSLEQYFQAWDDSNKKIFYERRHRQYDRLPVERARIITPANMIRAFASMFLAEPHRTTRSYKEIKAKVGSEIFKKGHRMEPYYTAALALYRLETLFRAGKVDSKLKPARFHILLGLRITVNGSSLPPMNSNAMEKYCTPIMEALWDVSKSEALFEKALVAVTKIANGNYSRDNIRTETFTNALLSELA